MERKQRGENPPASKNSTPAKNIVPQEEYIKEASAEEQLRMWGYLEADPGTDNTGREEARIKKPKTDKPTDAENNEENTVEDPEE